MNPQDLLDRIESTLCSAVREGYPPHPDELHLGPEEYRTMMVWGEEQCRYMASKESRSAPFKNFHYNGMWVKEMPVPGIRLAYVRFFSTT